MKKLLSVLVMVLFSGVYSHAQTTEALTNSIIIKMVKAKLSDDLIIDEINSSRVSFNVSADSLKLLSDKNVSTRIIQAMKSAVGTEIVPSETATITYSLPATIPVKDDSQEQVAKESALTLIETSAPALRVQLKDTLTMQAKEQVKPEALPLPELPEEKIIPVTNRKILSENSNISVNAVSYVIPLEELMIFFDTELNSLSGHLQDWDQQIRNSIEKGNQIKEKIQKLEKELTAKKNTDSKAFTTEIISLKNKLSEQRESYKIFENNMVTDGLSIVKEIDGIGTELEKSINKKFSEVSQIVKKTDPDPSVTEIPKSITISKRKIDDNIINHIAPVTEMLYCYHNQILALRDIIELWNLKVIAINKKDSELSKQLEPLKKELTNFQLNPKVNKEEISSLKKQCTNLEKERKLLTREMETDSKELAGFLTQTCKEVQSSVKQRLSDIIENIKYSYQDNFTYRDI